MLLIRLLLVPALIVLITLVSRRWGPALAGWLTGFPIVAGPILLVISLEQGAAFASSAALLSAVAAQALSFRLRHPGTATAKKEKGNT
jgi:hypothetical protein